MDEEFCKTVINQIAPSVLGTKEFWDNQYETDINAFLSDTNEIGEIWLGEDMQEKICEWIIENFPEIKQDTSTIDIGCGNAAFLIHMAEKYSFNNLTGIDYAKSAIELSKKIVAHHNLDEYITLKVLDMLDIPPNEKCYDFVHDKATFDAISLGEDKNMISKYIYGLCELLSDTPNSVLIVTSINFTQLELINLFETLSTPSQRLKISNNFNASNKSLKQYKAMKYPEIKFGGSSGSIAATVAFKWEPC